ncbi:O-antigen ligase family protein [Rhodohalobacter sulfatireducens]|uniref:O-antigen ligase family protein n=1 Tax=Rhodohalobacter sulfatireducens TaxID=2911366 RepID=A0ABS9KIV8_9BACT|nr:O-antigen ligase family protein [Rhodohalobacter sulfatireducens]MCG2590792.1 O-antigen ligase family protein [Rhodohalobacter sulfatireducens]
MKHESLNKLSIWRFLTVSGGPGYLLLAYPVIYALISRRREFDEVATVDTSATIQIILAVLSFTVAVYVFAKNRTHRRLLLNTPMKWLLLYAVWGGITMIWSVHLSMTAYRAFENIAYLSLITAVISRLYRMIGIEGMIDWILKYAVFTIFTGLLRRAMQFDLSIFSLETLFLEQMNSTPYFFLALLLPVGWMVKSFILPISIFSLSNTAYAGFATGILAFGRGNKWLKILLIVISFGILFSVSYWGPQSFLQSTIFYGQQGVGMEYTTGRYQLFELAYNEFLEKPFIGYGFVAGETFIINKVLLASIGTHNGLLSALLGTGAIGAFFFVMFFWGILRKTNSDLLPPKLRAVFLATAILITVHTMGNPGIGTRVYGTWIPAVIIFSMISMAHLHFKRLSSNENNLGYT